MAVLAGLQVFFLFTSTAQHPSRHRIDSLKNLLPNTRGEKRVDCFNALSEEYWWSPHAIPDSITRWALPALREALAIEYDIGKARSVLHLGVAAIFRKDCLSAEKRLKEALQIFEEKNNQRGIAWSNLWLGQCQYQENNFSEGINDCEKSIPILTSLDEYEGLGKAYAWMGFLYAAVGNYDSSFDYLSRSLLIREKSSDYMCVTGALTNLGHLYRTAGDLDDAMDYYQRGLKYAKEHDVNGWNYLDEPLGVIYLLMHKPDSSLYYLRQSIEIDPENKMTLIAIGETYLQEKKYDSALSIFLGPIARFRKGNDRWDLMRVLLDAGEAYLGKGESRQALKLIQEGCQIACEANVRRYMTRAYLLSFKAYQGQKKNDSASYFLQMYATLNDSVVNSDFRWKLTNYKHRGELMQKTQEIEQLNKDNLVKNQELERQSQVKWILGACLFLVLMVGFISYVSISLKRKNERLHNKQLEQDNQLRQLETERIQAELHQKTTQLEMEVLRAQMNPHFIFNSLNSINRFVLKNERTQASEYLTKFSRLVRMILQNSQATLITLESELDSLKLYLELEALRFDYHFEYRVSIPEDLDITAPKVPPLIIQPYVENAIWHGLMHKEETGKLEIDISQENDFLCIRVMDNGIGRKQSAALASKSVTRHKSMGMRITSQRINSIKHPLSGESPVSINDLVNPDGTPAGTEVIIKIPIEYD
jgi:tetratricopeptide (TPR) repeat protein